MAIRTGIGPPPNVSRRPFAPAMSRAMTSVKSIRPRIVKRSPRDAGGSDGFGCRRSWAPRFRAASRASETPTEARAAIPVNSSSLSPAARRISKATAPTTNPASLTHLGARENAAQVPNKQAWLRLIARWGTRGRYSRTKGMRPSMAEYPQARRPTTTWAPTRSRSRT